MMMQSMLRAGDHDLNFKAFDDAVTKTREWAQEYQMFAAIDNDPNT